MSEVKQSDIDFVVNALKTFFHQSIQRKNFNFHEFLTVMEETFKAAGYRTSQEPNEKNNILIIQDSGVGDFILASGVVREIRRLYPTAYITMVTYPRSENIAETCLYVNEVISKDRPYNNWHNPISFYMYDVEFAKNLLKRRYDVCYLIGGYVDSAFLMYMSGAKTRINQDRSNTPTAMYNFLATHHAPNISQHYVENAMAIIDYVLHARVANREIEVWLTNEDKALAQSLVGGISKPLYALCMGGTRAGNH